MVKLLVLADDLTGALDTGAQFASVGVKTVIAIPDAMGSESLKGESQVLVMDLQTRHRKAREAYEIVYETVKKAMKMGIRYVYKKTDSALRGNIGSEIEAALMASGEKCISFIPAFPRMNRVTVNGIHMIDGIPVNESVFGKDPFEPVKHARIKKIIRTQSGLPVWELKANELPEDSQASPGIAVYDAATDEQLGRIARMLWRGGRMRVTAGCAGFAACFPQILHLEKKAGFCRIHGDRMLVLSGSLNPISVKQICTAQDYGFGRVTLKREQKLEEGYWNTGEGKRELEKIRKKASDYKGFIIDSGSHEEALKETGRAGKGTIMGNESAKIAWVMGGVLKFLLDQGLRAVLFIIGGDTLRGFMERLQVSEIEPICELEAGIIYSRFAYRGRSYDLITKSGGFGGREVIQELFQYIVDGKEKEDGNEELSEAACQGL